MERTTSTNRVEIQNVEVHEIDEQTRIEVAFILNGRIAQIERNSSSDEQEILNAIGIASLDLIRILISRPLDCQIDYIKKVEDPPTVHCLLRLKDSGKESFLTGKSKISKSLYEAAVNAVLDSLERTLEKMIEFQQKRERIARSGSHAILEASAIAIATDISEGRTGNLSNVEELPSVSENKIETNEIGDLERKSANINDLVYNTAKLDKAEEFYKQGEALVKKGNYEKAASLLKEAVSLDNTQSSYYCQLGIALSNINAMEEAEKAFLKAVELKPSSDNYAELGLFYKDTGRVDKAQDALQKAIELDETDTRAKRTLNLVQELICVFEPSKKTSGSTKNVELSNYSKLDKKESNPKNFLAKEITPKILAIGLVVILAFLGVIVGSAYIYSYLSVMSKTSLSEKDLTHPNYIALKVVYDFPSSTKGLSIKERVEQYIKEQNIINVHWYAASESKSHKYIVTMNFTNKDKFQSAVWTVELDKKICTPNNDLARQLSAK